MGGSPQPVQAAPDVTRLYVKVEYGDQDITAQVQPYLTRLDYQDFLDGKQADKVVVSLADARGTFQGELYPVKGSALYFEFGYDKDTAFRSGKGYRIDSIRVTGGGGGDAVEWTASANIPSGDIHTRWCKTWADTSLKAIAGAIAEKHGLELIYECDDPVTLARLDQVSRSDLELLEKTAKLYGLTCSTKAGKDGPKLVLGDATFVLAKPPCFTVRRSDCTAFSFEDFAGLNTKGAYARWFDPATKKLVEGKREAERAKAKDPLKKSDAETLEGSGQQDRAVVREAMGRYAAKPPDSPERSATLELPGNPMLVSGATVELPKEEWLANGGVWAVKESKHTLDVGGGYKTSIGLKR
jgi:phage protein D